MKAKWEGLGKMGEMGSGQLRNYSHFFCPFSFFLSRLLKFIPFDSVIFFAFVPCSLLTTLRFSIVSNFFPLRHFPSFPLVSRHFPSFPLILSHLSRPPPPPTVSWEVLVAATGLRPMCS